MGAEPALPSWTARMGTDEMALIEPKLGARARHRRAAGGGCLGRSRTSPTGSSAPVTMTAGKAADVILGNTPLAAEQPFYRHEPSGDAGSEAAAPESG